MPIGFVLIKAAPDYEHEVYNNLLKVPEIIELHPLFEEYDLIAKIEIEDLEKLGEIVRKKIKSVKGVINTKTLAEAKF